MPPASSVCRPIKRPTPCSKCTTGEPSESSAKFLMMALSSIDAARLLCFLLATLCPSNCFSVTSSKGALLSLHTKLSSTLPITMETSLVSSMSCVNLAWACGRILAFANISSSASLCPVDSAINTTGTFADLAFLTSA